MIKSDNYTIENQIKIVLKKNDGIIPTKKEIITDLMRTAKQICPKNVERNSETFKHDLYLIYKKTLEQKGLPFKTDGILEPEQLVIKEYWENAVRVQRVYDQMGFGSGL